MTIIDALMNILLWAIIIGVAYRIVKRVRSNKSEKSKGTKFPDM